MNDVPDFSVYCEAACRFYWGEPDRKSFKDLCWGRRDGYGGKTYNLKKKRWYDAEAKCGGGTLQLIAFEQGWMDVKGKPDARKQRFFDAWRIGYQKKIIAEPPPEPRVSFEAKIRAIFPYKDENGKHVYDVVRFDTENKDERFRYRLPSGEWKLGKSRRILYRLTELIAAIKAGERVLVCEGEKDVESAVALGYAATTNCGGVGQWRVGYDQHFKGADVVIVGDNDDSGRKFAAERAGHLQKVAKSLHLVFPPEGKDLTEWVKAGGTRAQLDVLIHDVPDYRVQRQDKDGVPEAASSGDDDAELERLARLDLFDYERTRKPAAERLGVRATLLDKLIASKRGELGLDEADSLQGRPVAFTDPEPWPEAVDGDDLLDQITAAIKRHVVMQEAACHLTALWVVHSYLLNCFLISPRLAVCSPVKRCGKTTLLDALARLVLYPQAAANVTAAVIFRLIEMHRPCMLVDEADTYLRENEELRGVLNAGHRRGGTVLRSVGDDHEPRAFSVYGACAIALIGSLPDTLADRAIVVNLERRLASEPIEPFRLDRTDHLDQLARQAARWARDNAEAVRAANPQMPPGVFNREADNLQPLLAIADVAGGEWPGRARAAAMAGRQLSEDEASLLELLIGDIRNIFTEKKDQWISSATLIEALCEITPRPWAEYGRSGKPLTQNKLARLLKPLRIKPERLEVGDERARGYFRSHLDKVFERYLAPAEAQEGVSKCPSVREPIKSYTAPTFQSVRAEIPRTDAKVQETRMDTASRTHGHFEKGNGHLEGKEDWGLPLRLLDEDADWAEEWHYQHRDEPDVDAKLATALRERLRNKRNVRPEHLEIEAARVMDRVFAPRK
jgi:putative DNA primase/helicase